MILREEHQCRELFEDDGICKVLTEPRKQEEVYKGLLPTLHLRRYSVCKVKGII